MVLLESPNTSLSVNETSSSYISSRDLHNFTIINM